MSYAQLNSDNTLDRLIDHANDVVWDATHQCPASKLTADEALYFRVVEFVHAAAPDHDSQTHGVREATPELRDGKLVQQWEVYLLPGEVVAANQAAATAALQAQIVAATQARLDAFAQTRNFDSILSACTYVSSMIPKFYAEGQIASAARDATWGALYTVLDEVQAGTRPMPASFADIEPLLPALDWSSTP